MDSINCNVALKVLWHYWVLISSVCKCSPWEREWLSGRGGPRLLPLLARGALGPQTSFSLGHAQLLASSQHLKRRGLCVCGLGKALLCFFRSWPLMRLDTINLVRLHAWIVLQLPRSGVQLSLSLVWNCWQSYCISKASYYCCSYLREELTLWPRLASNLWPSSFVGFPSAEITSISHHTQLFNLCKLISCLLLLLCLCLWAYMCHRMRVKIRRREPSFPLSLMLVHLLAKSAH